ncbi:MAG: 2-dehydropantoate 2-reductase [Vicinamibacteria bacterium]
METIAIVGPGAVGGVLAGWLTKAGRSALTLCGRRAQPALTVETLAGPVAVGAPVHTDPSQARPVGWVLVTTKTYDAAGAAAWFPALVGPATRVAILQNGVEHRERFAPYVDAARIVPVMIDCPAERPSPDRVVQRGPGRMEVASDEDGRAFAALFAGTDLAVALTDDFRTAIWRKLCLNAAGALSALLLRPAGILRDDDLAEVARDLVRECVAVARAEGARLDDATVEETIAACRRAAPDSVNSLHADRAAGRPMEVDARNGAIVRIGRRHGIPTPCNRMAATLLEALAAAGR